MLRVPHGFWNGVDWRANLIKEHKSENIFLFWLRKKNWIRFVVRKTNNFIRLGIFFIIFFIYIFFLCYIFLFIKKKKKDFFDFSSTYVFELIGCFLEFFEILKVVGFFYRFFMIFFYLLIVSWPNPDSTRAAVKILKNGSQHLGQMQVQ